METIKNLPLMQRPREKLTHFGPSMLSNAELIAILLGSGTSKIPLMTICNDLIKLVDNTPQRLNELTIEEMCQIKGIGHVKAIVLSAALELGKRSSEAKQIPILLHTDAQVSELLAPYFLHQRQPGYFLVLLNNYNELLATHEILVDKKNPPPITNILKIVLDTGASEFFLCRKEWPLPEKYLTKEKALIIQLDATASMFDVKMRGLLVC
jgi:DNA repair protein RadC